MNNPKNYDTTYIKKVLAKMRVEPYYREKVNYYNYKNKEIRDRLKEGTISFFYKEVAWYKSGEMIYNLIDILLDKKTENFYTLYDGEIEEIERPKISHVYLSMLSNIIENKEFKNKYRCKKNYLEYNDKDTKEARKWIKKNKDKIRYNWDKLDMITIKSPGWLLFMDNKLKEIKP